MKNKPKRKQNWLKLKFKKHPYICFLIAWIISLALIYFFEEIYSIKIWAVFFVSIFLSLPLVAIIYWIIKNEIKIKLFFIKRKKIFKRILYSLGGVGSLGAIYLIAVIISIGGFTNFKERVELEYSIFQSKRSTYDMCNFSEQVLFRGFGDFTRFEFKLWTQYFDYFEEKEIKYKSEINIKKANSFLPFYKGDPEEQIKLARYYKNNELYIFNPCKSTRLLLKAAHQGNKTAQEMFAASFMAFGQYAKKEKVKDMNLKNPALAYRYAHLLDNLWGKSETPKNPEAFKYLKFSSDAGYLRAKEDLLSIYIDNFKMSNCKSIIEINNYLAEQKSFLNFNDALLANMGRIYGDRQKKIYKCLGSKPNFPKAFSILENLPRHTWMQNKSSSYRSLYPALFYLNGWGEVNQNHKKAYELFNNCNEGVHKSAIPKCIAYLSYMNFKGLGVEKNSDKGLDLAIKLIEKTPITKDKEDSSASGSVIPCGGTQYDFILSDSDDEEKKSQYRKLIMACLNKADEKANIKSLENYIKTSMVDHFKNPELFETINYLGEPQ